MKQIRRISLLKESIIFIASTIILVAFSSCATRKATFLNSAVVPAAEGTVKVKKDNNKNYAIKVEVKNLAEPDRLQPAKNVYVVWIETSDNGIKNIGQIKTSTAFLSGKLRAAFETVSSFNPVKLFITAENNPAIQYPEGQTILSTSNF